MRGYKKILLILVVCFAFSFSFASADTFTFNSDINKTVVEGESKADFFRVNVNTPGILSSITSNSPLKSYMVTGNDFGKLIMGSSDHPYVKSSTEMLYIGGANYQDDPNTPVDAPIITINGEDVGIGTTGPDTKLEIEGALGGDGLHLDSSSGAGVLIDRGAADNHNRLVFQTAGVTEWILGNAGENNANLYLYEDDNVPRITFEEGGFVGIGNTDPSEMLEVSGNIKLEKLIATSAEIDGTLGVTGNVNFDEYLEVTKGITIGAPVSDDSRLYIFNNFDGPAKSLDLYYDGSWGTAEYATDYRFIKASSTEGGNIFEVNGYGVGIGFAPPGYASSDALYINGNVAIGTVTTEAKLHIDSGSGAQNIRLAGSEIADNYDGMLHLRSGGSIVTFDGDDNIGVGTDGPQAKLDVRGNVVLESGTNPVVYTGTGAAEEELNRYLLLLNTPAYTTASGLKAGGVLIADDYGYGNPGKNDLIVKGNVEVGGTITASILNTPTMSFGNIELFEWSTPSGKSWSCRKSCKSTDYHNTWTGNCVSAFKSTGEPVSCGRRSGSNDLICLCSRVIEGECTPNSYFEVSIGEDGTEKFKEIGNINNYLNGYCYYESIPEIEDNCGNSGSFTGTKATEVACASKGANEPCGQGYSLNGCTCRGMTGRRNNCEAQGYGAGATCQGSGTSYSCVAASS